MRKVKPPPAPEPKAPQPAAPKQTDLSALLAVQTCMVDEMRRLAEVVVDARKGPLRVEIERDSDGRMKTLLIERVRGH